jgi:hypothetical protein
VHPQAVTLVRAFPLAGSGWCCLAQELVDGTCWWALGFVSWLTKMCDLAVVQNAGLPLVLAIAGTHAQVAGGAAPVGESPPGDLKQQQRRRRKSTAGQGAHAAGARLGRWRAGSIATRQACGSYLGAFVLESSFDFLAGFADQLRHLRCTRC